MHPRDTLHLLISGQGLSGCYVTTSLPQTLRQLTEIWAIAVLHIEAGHSHA